MVGICSQSIPKEAGIVPLDSSTTYCILLFQVTKLNKIGIESISMTVTSRLMLFGDTVAVYCGNRTEYISTPCVCVRARVRARARSIL